MPHQSPIVFLVYNRPEVTARVFETIRSVQPGELFVVADGPKDEHDRKRCDAVRKIVSDVDWPCATHYEFADSNLGCRERVSSGVTAAFSRFDRAIILEDDCLPSEEFFNFCDVLLEHYQDQQEVMMISGDNFQPGVARSEASYYFSRYPQVWGWATWKRAWQSYDVSMHDWPERKKANWLADVFEDQIEIDFWDELFSMVHDGVIPTWDYQWVYALFKSGGLSVVPNANLVSNIGFGEGATHTQRETPFANLPHQRLGPLRFMQEIEVSRAADSFTFEHVFGGAQKRRERSFVGRVLNLVSRVQNRIFSL